MWSFQNVKCFDFLTHDTQVLGYTLKDLIVRARGISRVLMTE